MKTTDECFLYGLRSKGKDLPAFARKVNVVHHTIKRELEDFKQKRVSHTIPSVISGSNRQSISHKNKSNEINWTLTGSDEGKIP